MDLSEINKQALVQQKPTQKLRDLPKDQPFPIISAKVVKGKYGKCILLELDEVVVFLPNRMTSILQGKESNFSSKKYNLVLRDVVNVGAHETCQFEIIEK